MVNWDLITIVVYFSLTVYSVSRIIARNHLAMEEESQRTQAYYQQLLEARGDFEKTKKQLEGESSKIFTLYELTREIIKSSKEEDAFRIFKAKLRDNIEYGNCLFLKPNDEGLNEWRKSKENFVFPLQGKDEKIGYLIINDIDEEDRETAAILGSQYALALRRVRLYEKIEHLAMTDSLTEVGTRRAILNRLEEEIGRAQIRKTHTSLIMLDVDHFKQVNDQHGHLTGDQVLRSVGKIIRENIREIDIAGRYGGEEFCIVLPETDKEGARLVAERIRRSLEIAVIRAYDAEFKTTVSLGIAAFPLDANSKDELIEKADFALYQAKEQGRNRICIFGEPAKS